MNKQDDANSTTHMAEAQERFKAPSDRPVPTRYRGSFTAGAGFPSQTGGTHRENSVLICIQADKIDNSVADVVAAWKAAEPNFPAGTELKIRAWKGASNIAVWVEIPEQINFNQTLPKPLAMATAVMEAMANFLLNLDYECRA